MMEQKDNTPPPGPGPTEAPGEGRDRETGAGAPGAVAHGGVRRRHLERIVVQQFSHLLADEGAEPTRPGGLSRCVVAGFLAALGERIAPQRMAAYRRRGAAIVERIEGRPGEEFDWRSVYRDEEAQWLANDLLVDVARQFETLHEHKSWLIDAMARAMRPIGPAERPGEGRAGPAPCRFGVAEFRAMMQALYADLGSRLADRDGRGRVVERYGDGGAGMISRVLHDLDRCFAATTPAPRPA